jgi:cytochrome c oxidase assembly protein subunit 15
VLGGLQGLLGWYMVKSGLINVPQVSHFRLTAHLALAFLLFGATLWQALRFFDQASGRRVPVQSQPLLFRLSLVLLALLFLQVSLGAMVAGLKAGYLYNTFPKMGDYWIPPGTWQVPLHNPTSIQFFHRLCAYLIVLLIGWLWCEARRANCDARQRQGVLLLVLAGMGQVALGIATLLLAVPIALGSLHQLGALVLFGCSIALCHSLRSCR